MLKDEVQEKFSQQILRFKAEIDLNKPNILIKEKEKEICNKILKEIEQVDHFDNECDLDLLVISFDTFSFISQARRLIDVEGRLSILDNIRNQIKELLEVDFCLGNCIYEDDENLCFLIATISNESKVYLKDRIFEIFNHETKGLLIPVIEFKENLKFYGKSLAELRRKCKQKILTKEIEPKYIEKLEWRNEWKNGASDICILCNKMPQKDREEKLCEFCKKVRYSFAEKTVEGTRWLDEIADQNGKIALLVGKFEPLDKWLSGEFLKYQKIKTIEDVKKVTKRSELPSFEESIEKLMTEYPKQIKQEKDFTKVLRKNIGELSKNEDWGIVISYRTRMGEIRERIREVDEDMVKKWEENKLSKNEKNKLKELLIEIIETKPPSPSRLLRIWRELENFSELKEILADKNIPKGIRISFESTEFKEKIKELGFYVAHLRELGEITVYWDGEKLFTVERIDKSAPEDKEENNVLKKHKEMIEKLEGKETDLILKEEKSKKIIGNFKVKIKEEKEYYRYRKIITSPTGFMVIIPANKALEISQKIVEKFYQDFSKVLGKISLNIGIVFAQRKMPMFAVLDTAKRVINEFSFLEKGPKTAFVNMECAYLKNHEILPLKLDGKDIFWKIDTKLGDKENEDRYYPYFISEDGKPIHFSELKPEDKIKIYPNFFDFIYLDSNARRFEITMKENGKREHPILGGKGSRPYLLEGIEKFIALREIFKKIGKWSPIRDVEALAQAKYEEWDLKENPIEEKVELYRKFIEAVVQNKLSRYFDKENFKNNIKPFIVNCIMDGTFFDAIELFESIMKVKLKGEEYGS